MTKSNPFRVSKAQLKMCALALLITPMLAACGGSGSYSDINNSTKFSSAEFGVSASRRVTTSNNIPKGGGRYQVGKPYRVAGRWYTPKHQPNYNSTGKASWYGPNFHGRETANGEIFDQYAISAAHPTLPLPSYVRVTNLENNRSIVVRVNDRGPFAHGREIDLSRRAAELLDFQHKGVAQVRVQYVGQAPLEGDDTAHLMASLNGPDPTKLRTTSRTVRTASTRRQGDPGGLVGAAMRATRDGLAAIGLSYAEQNAPSININAAFDAIETMAPQSASLSDWQKANDANARDVNIAIGVFRSPETISELSTQFALLGAVQKDSIRVKGKLATALRITHLKSGVTIGDIEAMAQNLGLNDIKLY